jgi:hypothetical protein
MPVDQRNEINRRNAQHSTGPRTPAGRAAVAQNRVIHNLTGDTVLLPGESQQAFEELRAALLTEHAPVGNTEQNLVERLAYNQWRLDRIAAMETEILANMAGLPTGSETPAALAARNMIDSSKTALDAHTRLIRYETSTRRCYDTALTQLRVTQKARLSTPEAKNELAEQVEEQTKNEAMQMARDAGIVPETVENPICDSNPNPDLDNVPDTPLNPADPDQNP